MKTEAESGRPNIQEESQSRNDGRDTSSIIAFPQVMPKGRDVFSSETVTEPPYQRKGRDLAGVSKAANSDEESTWLELRGNSETDMRPRQVSSKLVAGTSSSHHTESSNGSKTSIGNSSNGDGIKDGSCEVGLKRVNEAVHQRDHSGYYEDIALQEMNELEPARRVQSNKRKRMGMRQDKCEVSPQQPYLPENSEREDEALLSPGRLVTLDFALKFSNIPR